jgi:hypothetical protein
VPTLLGEGDNDFFQTGAIFLHQAQGYALPTKCNHMLYNSADVESALLHLDATLKLPVRPKSRPCDLAHSKRPLLRYNGRQGTMHIICAGCTIKIRTYGKTDPMQPLAAHRTALRFFRWKGGMHSLFVSQPATRFACGAAGALSTRRFSAASVWAVSPHNSPREIGFSGAVGAA